MALLERMSWREAETSIKDNLVIIPTGSIEQHGPHMPLGADYFEVDKMAKEIGRKSDYVVAPTIPVGYADYHDDFAGTLSVDTPILVDYVDSIVKKLVKYGASHVLFLNGHGGNATALVEVVYRLRKRGVPAAMINWYDIVPALRPDLSPAGHGDWIETSIVLAVDEDLVNMDIAKQPEYEEIDVEGLELTSPHTLRYRGVDFQVRTKTRDFTIPGNMQEAHLSATADTSIPPSEATAQIGETVVKTVVDFVCEFGEKFMQFTYPYSS